MVNWEIRPEREDDGPGILALTEAAFGPGRYAKSAYRLREGVNPIAALGFVAVEIAILRGSVRFWPIKVGTEAALLMGPLAVETAQRGRGLGISLMQTGIEAARRQGWRALLLVGDEPYYGRVGFSKLRANQVQFPGPVDADRLLALGLAEGVMGSLCGPVRRGAIDRPVSADGAPLG